MAEPNISRGNERFSDIKSEAVKMNITGLLERYHPAELEKNVKVVGQWRSRG